MSFFVEQMKKMKAVTDKGYRPARRPKTDYERIFEYAEQCEDGIVEVKDIEKFMANVNFKLNVMKQRNQVERISPGRWLVFYETNI